ncbi:membrane protein insertase YidC [Patescibacteria group bacterium]|nr:membrane protein insertase YidC [Patescibacteria group bacterium]
MQWFTIIFEQPLYNLLVWLYINLPGADIGLAIIVVTVIIKGVLFPLTFKSLKSQREMQEIQPKIQELRQQYKDDKERMAKELMSVYKDHNVNPLASCLPLLIQLPIFIALFRVLKDGLGEVNADLLYAFVPNPGMIDAVSLGFINLAEIFIPLAILAAAAQYFQAKLTIAQRPPKTVRKEKAAMDENMMASMNKMMLYFMPVITLVIGVTSLPGGVMLYWFVTTALTAVLYSIFLKKKKEPAEEKS